MNYRKATLFFIAVSLLFGALLGRLEGNGRAELGQSRAELRYAMEAGR